MNFPQITIPDPAAVGKWLDEQIPPASEHCPMFRDGEWQACHWFAPAEYVFATGDSPESLLAKIRELMGENDPLAKLRKEAEQHGYGLMKLPED